MQFSTPQALLLLFILPGIAYVGWPARAPSRAQGFLALGLRLAIVTLVILALAGLEFRRPADKLGVVFLLDRSDSISESAQQEGMEFLEAAIAEMGPDDQSALVTFGENALVERPLSDAPEFDSITSLPGAGGSDIEAAIRLAQALFPPDTARRIVLLTDGLQTSGDALEAIRLAGQSGIDFLVVPLTSLTGPETALTGVNLPDRLFQGERFDLDLTVLAHQNGQAIVQVWAGESLVTEQALDIRRGEHVYRLPQLAGTPGFVPYRVLLNPLQDRFYQNNELSAYAFIEGPPRVLLVAPPAGESLPFQTEPRPDEFGALLNALTASGLNVEYRLPSGLPADLASLAQFSSLILVDVPARDLAPAQLQTIQSYVRDLGGGLVSIGGPTSYGVGGYYRTPLEETLPVDMQIKDELRKPSLTIVFVIDRSGSMGESSGGVSKLELAKEAAARSIDLLFPGDRVGVVAFDDNARWVVPLTDLTEPRDILEAIGSLRSGGGTDILAGLQPVAEELPGDSAALKHIILLTDGGANPAGIPELVTGMHERHQITLSSVGIGQDAAPFLADLARRGGGRYHFTDNPAAIPSIFTEETSLATRAYLVEETFTPRLIDPGPLLIGIRSIPPLHGYVGTTAKGTARTVMESELGDPILATWRYGLGKSVAYTSDAAGRWGRDWITWDQFPTFWSQIVGWSLQDPVSSPVTTRFEMEEGRVRVVIQALGTDGDPLNLYQFSATLVDPEGEASLVPFRQTGPGTYRGDFTPQSEGPYLLRLRGSPPEPEEPTLFDTIAWVRKYSPEYDPKGEEAGLLSQIAELPTVRLFAEKPAAVFQHNLPAPPLFQPVWQTLIIMASLLLPIDVGLRRLAFQSGDLHRVRAWFRAQFPLPPQSSDSRKDDPRSSVATLLEIKDRTRQGEESPYFRTETQTHSSGSDPIPKPAPKEGIPAPSQSEPLASDLEPEGPTLAARLLAEKKSRQDQGQND